MGKDSNLLSLSRLPRKKQHPTGALSAAAAATGPLPCCDAAVFIVRERRKRRGRRGKPASPFVSGAADAAAAAALRGAAADAAAAASSSSWRLPDCHSPIPISHEARRLPIGNDYEQRRRSDAAAANAAASAGFLLGPGGAAPAAAGLLCSPSPAAAAAAAPAFPFISDAVRHGPSRVGGGRRGAGGVFWRFRFSVSVFTFGVLRNKTPRFPHALHSLFSFLFSCSQAAAVAALAGTFSVQQQHIFRTQQQQQRRFQHQRGGGREQQQRTPPPPLPPPPPPHQ